MTSIARTNAKRKVRSYFQAAGPEARKHLRALRAAIRAAAPRAVEGFSYGIPCFQLNGRVLVWYAAFRDHSSLYPMTPPVRRAFRSRLRGYKTAKGTVQFPLTSKVPIGLVKSLVRARLALLRDAK
jgi:uncharacterized protein YdhG (YjbR/CyaY superfamily)